MNWRKSSGQESSNGQEEADPPGRIKTVVNAQLQNTSILNSFCHTMVSGRYVNTSCLPVRFKRYPRSYVPFQLWSKLPSATPMKMKKLHPWLELIQIQGSQQLAQSFQSKCLMVTRCEFTGFITLLGVFVQVIFTW